MLPWFAWKPHRSSGRKSSIRFDSLFSSMQANTSLAWKKQDPTVVTAILSVTLHEDDEIGYPSSLHGVGFLYKLLISSFNNFWTQSICTRKLSVTELRDNLTHFIQHWSFIHPMLDWPLINVFNHMLFHHGRCCILACTTWLPVSWKYKRHCVS